MTSKVHENPSKAGKDTNVGRIRDRATSSFWRRTIRQPDVEMKNLRRDGSFSNYQQKFDALLH